jgi:hypothetical protein
MSNPNEIKKRPKKKVDNGISSHSITKWYGFLVQSVSYLFISRLEGILKAMTKTNDE